MPSPARRRASSALRRFHSSWLSTSTWGLGLGLNGLRSAIAVAICAQPELPAISPPTSSIANPPRIRAPAARFIRYLPSPSGRHPNPQSRPAVLGAVQFLCQNARGLLDRFAEEPGGQRGKAGGVVGDEAPHL